MEHMKKTASSIRFCVITVSTSRYYGEKAEDLSGGIAVKALKRIGRPCCRFLAPDSYELVLERVLKCMELGAEAVVLVGGTGATRDDLSDLLVRDISEKILYGFGEEFRRRSVESAGPRGMVGNALLGLRGGSAILALPGSPDAVELGVNLFIEVAPHIIGQRRDVSGNNVG